MYRQLQGIEEFGQSWNLAAISNLDTQHEI